jgi:hypothetical protein
MSPAAQPSDGARTVRAAVADSLAVDAVTVEVLDALRRAGLRPLLLKGPAIAALLYGPGAERHWDDTDLLVSPADEERALEQLARLGFELQTESELKRDRVPHETHLVRDAVYPSASGRIRELVDLHRSFAGVGANPQTFWSSLDADRDAIELFGRRVDVPSVPARLALVALHAAAHGRPSLRPRQDLERAVSRRAELRDAFAAAAALARRWQALDYFVAGIRLDPAGERLLAAIGIEHQPSRAARMRAAGMGPGELSLEHLARVRGTRRRIELIAATLVPSPETMRESKPIARRGPLGLLVAYLWRPFWLLGQLALAITAYVRAGRR